MDYKALGKAAIQGIGCAVGLVLAIIGIAYVTALVATAFGGIAGAVVTIAIILSIWFTVVFYVLRRDYR